MKRRLCVLSVNAFVCFLFVVFMRNFEDDNEIRDEQSIDERVPKTKIPPSYMTTNSNFSFETEQRQKDNSVFNTSHVAELKSYYTKMKFGPVYILGAAAGNTSENGEWELIKVYAIINLTAYEKTEFYCCLKYNMASEENEILKIKPINIVKFWTESILLAHHFTCPNIKHSHIMTPVGVALTVSDLSCEELFVTYIQPYFPPKEPGIKLALGTKLAYGPVSAELIIEWMEAYKYLGVDKVVTYYVNDIRRDALKVLKYYSSTGLLDLYHHTPAASDLEPRNFRLSTRQKWNDCQMLIFDSFERMSGYTYFGIIDHDEFLIPSSNRSMKKMLGDLYGIYGNAAGFVFQAQYYFLDWGKSGTISDLILGTYLNREESSPRIDNEKNIYMPKYTALGGVHTHYTKAIRGFKMIVVPSQQGFIRHYRNCRYENKQDCLNQLKRVNDTTMAEWSTRIEQNVQKVRKRVFGRK